ncbi:DNA-directed RNA polymerase subunit omega [Sporomusa rhizae]
MHSVTNGESALIESKSNKPVTIALEEIAQGKIVYQRTKIGIK